MEKLIKEQGDKLSESDKAPLESAIAKVREAAAETDVKTELLCADIFNCADRFRGRFDTIVASGFIGTFHHERLDRLLALLRDSLITGGELVNLTWHGPHRTPEQTAEKLKYGYDTLEEHQPQAFLAQIERAGFIMLQHEIFTCDPQEYGWDVIQGCVLQRRG